MPETDWALERAREILREIVRIASTAISGKMQRGFIAEMKDAQAEVIAAELRKERDALVVRAKYDLQRAEAAEKRAAALEAALRDIEAIAGGLDEEEASFIYTTTYQRALKIARGALADLSGALAEHDAGVRKAALLEAASEADRHYTEGIATWLRELAEKERG